MDCLPFVYCSPPNRTLVNMTSFSHSYVKSYLEFRPPDDKWLEDCIKSEAGAQKPTLQQIQHSGHTQTIVTGISMSFFTQFSLS